MKMGITKRWGFNHLLVDIIKDRNGQRPTHQQGEGMFGRR
jgi:hypothetical protein